MNNKPETFDDLSEDWLNADYKPSEDGLICKEAIEYAAAKIKAESTTHIHKPNPEFHELADVLDKFEASDIDGALGEARRITRMSVFEGKKTWPLVKIRDLMNQMNENYTVIVAGSEVIAKVEEVIAATMVAKYYGPKFKLTVPHPQVGILRRRAFGEDEFSKDDL